MLKEICEKCNKQIRYFHIAHVNNESCGLYGYNYAGKLLCVIESKDLNTISLVRTIQEEEINSSIVHCFYPQDIFKNKTFYPLKLEKFPMIDCPFYAEYQLEKWNTCQ